MAEFLATIRGIPHLRDVKEINVREGPGTNFANPFKAPVGMSGLRVLDVQPDSEGKNFEGKVYQWFKLQFHGGAVGWVRDDLLFIEGDGTQWGYPNLSTRTFAFDVRRAVAVPVPPPVVAPTTSSGVAVDDIERVKRASFAITAAFEGGSYKAYNNYDAGIVSYGLFQFTLAAGSLQTVLDRYLAASQTPQAELVRKFMGRVVAKDPALRNDMDFKNALLAAADDPAMQKAQMDVGTEKYWNAVVDGYITPRGLKTPLAYALLFDMGINFGTGHGFVRLAEQELGVPPRSRPGENGITEEQLIAKVAELRKRSHDKQAERDKLPGLRVRGDFWVNLVNAGDWALQGNAGGFVNVNGRMVQVRNP